MPIGGILHDAWQRYWAEAKMTPWGHTGLFLAWVAMIGGVYWAGWHQFPVFAVASEEVARLDERVSRIEGAIVSMSDRAERQEVSSRLERWETQVRAIDTQLLSIHREVEAARARNEAVPAIYAEQRTSLESEKEALVRRINQLLRSYPYLMTQR